MKNLWMAIAFLFSGLGLQAQTPLDQARKAIVDEDYTKAKALLQKLLAESKKAENYYYMGLACLESGIDADDPDEKRSEMENAKGYFQSGLTNAKGKYPYNYVGLGRYFVATKNFTEAKSNFDKALELTGGTDVELLVTIAQGYMNSTDRGLLDEATKLLTKARSIDPKQAAIYTGLGDLYRIQKVQELAMSNYQEAIKLNPNFVEGHFKLGLLYLKDKKYNEGAASFTKCIQIDPGFAPAYREMGELYFLAKDYKKAKENYKTYVAKTEGDLKSEVRYCQFLYLSKEHNEAIAKINEVMKDTFSIVLQRLLGYSLIETGKYNDGKAALDKYFTKMKPEWQIAQDFASYGKALDSLGQDSLAVGYYEKAIALEKERNDELTQAMFDCWYSLKSYQKAADVLSKMSKMTVKEYFNMGRCYYSLQDWKKAEENYKKVTELKADFIPAWKQLTTIAGKMDPELKEFLAKPYYEKLWELTEKEAEKYKTDRGNCAAYLGFYYYSKQELPKAMYYAEKGAELNPANKNNLNLLEDLKKRKVVPSKD